MTVWVLIAALLLDAALGEPRWLWSRLPHPAVLMGRAVAVLDAAMNTGALRRAKGVAAIAVLVLGALLIGFGVEALPLAPVWEGLIAAILLAQRSLVDHVREVGDALCEGLERGRDAVGRIVSRDTSTMDEAAVARAAIESAAENFSDGVVAPAFWFLLLGLPGIIAYKAINTADSMIGYRTPRHEAFGWAAARLDDVVNWVPARLSAALIALAFGLRDASGIGADARRHRSPNAGWPEAAMARALGVALAGPRSYDGQTRDFAFVNAGGAREIGRDAVWNAARALWRVWALAVGLLAVAALALA